ncbi:polysaccharide biosynthesis tyrosine autokinase [Synechococcales cyanobacterium C]|uniref:Polysaccharide biosynthesis tyrosine autokinase n=1 Tax=Petrachloros mirabilis ULC683 TaxID=2781853 RepID=A0A8K2A863_9CYAN|nr:polysaccharide biosynthesis tyrosine autokinase [Petrachloros mirabilis]NCJ07656.1 polysaccharide biosynthesis tyrosine autokinase [Petrachloros mirabilis ULC683]
MDVEKTKDAKIWQYWTMFRRRWIPATSVFLGVFILLLINALSKTDIYRSQGLLLFKSENSDAGIRDLEGLSLAGVRTSEDELATHIEVMLSKPILEGVATSIQTPSDEENTFRAEDLRQAFKITPIEKTRVLKVGFDNPNPHIAQTAVNQIMLSYIRNNLARNRAASISVRQFIDEQLPEVKQRLFEAESAVRRFREAYNIVEPETSARVFAQKQSDLQTNVEMTNAELQNLEAQILDAQQKIGMTSTEALAVSALSSSTAVQDSLGELETVERDLAIAKATLSPNHPQIQNLEEEQTQLQGVLQGSVSRLIGTPNSPSGMYQTDLVRDELMTKLVELEVKRDGLRSQIAVAEDYQRLYQQQANLIPGIEQQYRELMREFKAAEGTYAALLKSLQEVRVTENQTIPTVEVIETASLPLNPIYPNRIADVVRSLVLGILAATGVVYLLEASDRKLKTADAIREVYPYPLLGAIPFFRDNQSSVEHLETLHQGHSALGESYRILQSNLKFLNSDNALQALVVSSAIPSEGKSTTIASLAVTLADMGHSVLLIDADTRRPSQHQLWEVSNQEGLSSFLSNPEEQEIIPYLKSVLDNVDLMTAGVIPPNPLLLLDSDRMRQLITSQTEKYDYVIIDAPPISVATDALVLSKMTNGLLLVARPDVIEKNIACRIQESLIQFDVHVLGLVVNGILTKNETSTYYYHQYYTAEVHSEINNGKLTANDKVKF